MKKISITIIAILVSIISFGQMPRTFKYQAIARDASNQVLSNRTVNLKISIVTESENGPIVYSETHMPTTNANGLLNLEIGAGAPVLGTFDNISWGTAAYYVKIEMDADGGENFKELGTSKLLAVPYALYAESAGGNVVAPTGKPLLKSGSTSQWTTLDANSIQSDYSNVGIGTGGNIPTAALDVRGSTINSSPSVYGTQIAAGAIVLAKDAAPYIDFNLGNGSSFGAQLYYRGPYEDVLAVYGADFKIYQKLTVVDQTGIGTTKPNASAILDVTSNYKGFLPPRMTKMDRDNIANPAVGLQIFNTTTNCLNFYTPSGWYEVCGSPSPTGPCSGFSYVYDADYNGYNTVEIGTQCWMKENLRTGSFNNYDGIDYIEDDTDWANLTTGAYCIYNNDWDNYNTYGGLYNWYAVNDSRGICPDGWHVPSDSEWTTLENYLGGSSVAGGKMKEAGTEHWLSPNTGATNESGFNGLPGSYRGSTGSFPSSSIGEFGNWWSSTEKSSTTAENRFLRYLNEYIGHLANTFYKNSGLSVRCVKD